METLTDFAVAHLDFAHHGHGSRWYVRRLLQLVRQLDFVVDVYGHVYEVLPAFYQRRCLDF